MFVELKLNIVLYGTKPTNFGWICAILWHKYRSYAQYYKDSKDKLSLNNQLSVKCQYVR